MKPIYIFKLIICFILFCTFSTHASPIKPIWKKGQITFWNKTIIEGNLSYNWFAEMVMISQADGRISTFSVNQIAEFGWFDYSQHKYRKFTALPIHSVSERSSYGFFEICMNGNLEVVRRLKLPRGFLKKAFSHPTNFTDTPELAHNPEHFDYYVYDSGRMLPFNDFYSAIYNPILANYDKQLQTYVFTHNINPRTLLGRLVLIDQYNLLVQQEKNMASIRSNAQSPNE